ncbi:hypothetical protein Tco_1253650 [Tanacetum coccineum]
MVGVRRVASRCGSAGYVPFSSVARRRGSVRKSYLFGGEEGSWMWQYLCGGGYRSMFRTVRSYLHHEQKHCAYGPFRLLSISLQKGMPSARLLRWGSPPTRIMTSKFIDTKGAARNLAADSSVQMENPYENVKDPKEIK